MIRFQSFRRKQLITEDGPMGAVYDMYFDDVSWRIRYVVVDTRRWLPGRKVLLPPGVIRGDRSWGEGIPVELSRDDVKGAPGVDTELPVSKRNEAVLLSHYQWALRFTHAVVPAFTASVPVRPIELLDAGEPTEPQLRSAREILGYRVLGPEGSLGEVEDLRFDKSTFSIRSIEVDTKTPLDLPVVPVSPRHVRGIRWKDRAVLVDLDFGNLAGLSGGSQAFPA